MQNEFGNLNKKFCIMWLHQGFSYYIFPWLEMVLWSLLIRTRISLGVIWFKCAFCVCTVLLRIPHDLTKIKKVKRVITRVDVYIHVYIFRILLAMDTVFTVLLFLNCHALKMLLCGFLYN